VRVKRPKIYRSDPEEAKIYRSEPEETKNLQIRVRRGQKSTDPSPKRQVYPEKSQFLSPSYDI